MRNKGHNNVKILTATIALSSVLLSSCAVSRTNKTIEDSPLKQDSVDVFVPTHPPVIINKTWREVMNKE